MVDDLINLCDFKSKTICIITTDTTYFIINCNVHA